MRELDRIVYEKFTTSLLEDLLQTHKGRLAGRPQIAQFHLSPDAFSDYVDALATRMGDRREEWLAIFRKGEADLSYGPTKVFVNPSLRGKVISLVHSGTGPVIMGRSGSVRD